MVKNPPENAGDAMQIRSLGWNGPLEEGMATHSSILAQRIPWTEEPGRLPTVHWVTELDTTEAAWLAHAHTGQGVNNRKKILF